MFVADAESNIIRAIELPPVNTVRTLVGGDLFEFGDVDASGDAVRLQHPLGVAAFPDGRVAIADTYNHKIKVLDPQTGSSEDAGRQRQARTHRRPRPQGTVLRAGRVERHRRKNLRR
jgi:NHL repeat